MNFHQKVAFLQLVLGDHCVQFIPCKFNLALLINILWHFFWMFFACFGTLYFFTVAGGCFSSKKKNFIVSLNSFSQIPPLFYEIWKFGINLSCLVNFCLWQYLPSLLKLNMTKRRNTEWMSVRSQLLRAWRWRKTSQPRLPCTQLHAIKSLKLGCSMLCGTSSQTRGKCPWRRDQNLPPVDASYFGGGLNPNEAWKHADLSSKH